MILLSRDHVDHVVSTWKGDRCIGVVFKLTGSLQTIVLVSCHLPHNNNSDYDFFKLLKNLMVVYMTGVEAA